jgi:hypothetical protein
MLVSYEISYYSYLKYCGIKYTRTIKLRNVSQRGWAGKSVLVYVDDILFVGEI